MACRPLIEGELTMAKIPQRLGEYCLMRHIRLEAGTEIYRAVNLGSQDKRVLTI